MKSARPERVPPEALAVLTGTMLAGAFPPVAFGWLAWAAFIPFLLALHPPGGARERVLPWRRAFRAGWIAGFVFFLLLLHWIPRLPRENVTIPFLMYPALIVIAAYLALYPAAAAAGSAWLGRRGVPVGLSLPVFWTLLEAARSTGTFGFPWGAVGYAMATLPQHIQFASVTGMWGVTLWVLLLNGLVHGYLALPHGPRKLLAAAGFLVLLVVPAQHGRAVLSGAEPRAAVRVGLIQPNVGVNKWERAVRDSIVHGLLDDTRALAESAPRIALDLIAWPETAIPARLPREPYYLELVESLVEETGVPLLAGFPDGEPRSDGGYRFTNSAALVIPGMGMVERYDKRHLVPFSEYMPVPWLNRYDFGQANFSAGAIPGVVEDLEVPFGILICFESAFPGLARETVRGGARYLVNITNDQWFGDSAAPEQHFTMNVLRAIENGVGIARAANTGVSGVIDPQGRVRERTATFVSAALISPVELTAGLTFYTRHGDWILLVLGAAGAGMTAWGVIRGRRR